MGIIMIPIKSVFVKTSQVLSVLLFTFNYAQAGGALDPLDKNEIEKAKKIQLSYVRENQPDLISDTPSLSANRSPFVSKIEVLLVERHTVKKGEERHAQRLADVYSYDYEDNVLNQMIVNLDTESVVSVTRNSKVQLPLTENEVQKATEILMADQEQYKLILKEFKQITGEEYTNPAQIEIKAFAFWGKTLPGISNADALKCGSHRCAQMLLYTPERVAFEASPVIDLTTKKIVQNIDF